MDKDLAAQWAEILSAAREIVVGWTDEQIISVMGKVRADSPDLLFGHIGEVLAWCAAAQEHGDEEDKACVDLWQMDGMPIEICVGSDGRIAHRLDPEVSVSFVRE